MDTEIFICLPRVDLSLVYSGLDALFQCFAFQVKYSVFVSATVFVVVNDSEEKGFLLQICIRGLRSGSQDGWTDR